MYSGYLPFINHHPLVVGDTQSDSIQCLNFAKKWSIQYSIQYCFTQDSIQNIIQFQKKSADSIQKMIQFNSQGIMDTGRIGKGPKNCPKSVKYRQKKGAYRQKWRILIQNMTHSFILQWNSIKRIIQYQIFQEVKKLCNNLFSRNIQFKSWFENLNVFFFSAQFENLNVAIFNSTKYSFN